jgi:hypothetical protein
MSTNVYNHSVTLYAYLEHNARQATEGNIYEGSLKVATVACDVPFDYYQRTRNLLGEMECIRYLVTGHGRNPSVIHLMRRPSLEIYNEYRALKSGKGGKKRTSEITTGLINDLANRVKAVERDQRTILGILRAKGIHLNDD